MSEKSPDRTNPIFATRKRYPLITFFILAFAFSWTMVALVPVSFVFALLALFGPAIAGLLVSAVSEGKKGVAALRAWIFHAFINVSNSLFFVGNLVTQ